MIKIIFDSEIPIYIQLKDEIIKEIAKGVLVNGDTLPSIRQLSIDLGVNLHTVNKAYNILKNEGYLTIDRRKGAMVSLNNENIDLFKKELRDNLEVMIAKAICKDFSKEKILNEVEEIYKELKGD